MDAAVTRELLTSMSNSIQASLDHLSSIMEICANKPYKSHKAEQTIRTAKCLIENDFKLREGALKLFEIETRLQAAPSAATQALARAQVNYVAADDAYNAAVANHATTRSEIGRAHV